MSVIREESGEKNVGIISMQDFLHFLKVRFGGVDERRKRGKRRYLIG